MKELKVLTVCGAGVGTSALLKMNVESAFSGLRLPFRVTVSHTGLSRAKALPADIIFTFETFAHDVGEFSAPVIMVENLMDVEEIKRKIELYLEQNPIE